MKKSYFVEAVKFSLGVWYGNDRLIPFLLFLLVLWGRYRTERHSELWHPLDPFNEA